MFLPCSAPPETPLLLLLHEMHARSSSPPKHQAVIFREQPVQVWHRDQLKHVRVQNFPQKLVTAGPKVGQRPLRIVVDHLVWVPVKVNHHHNAPRAEHLGERRHECLRELKVVVHVADEGGVKRRGGGAQEARRKCAGSAQGARRSAQAARRKRAGGAQEARRERA